MVFWISIVLNITILTVLKLAVGIIHLGGEDADVEDFVMAAVSYRENDFKAEYADYPKVLEKFAIIREILGEIGFKLK